MLQFLQIIWGFIDMKGVFERDLIQRIVGDDFVLPENANLLSAFENWLATPEAKENALQRIAEAVRPVIEEMREKSDSDRVTRFMEYIRFIMGRQDGAEIPERMQDPLEAVKRIVFEDTPLEVIVNLSALVFENKEEYADKILLPFTKLDIAKLIVLGLIEAPDKNLFVGFVANTERIDAAALAVYKAKQQSIAVPAVQGAEERGEVNRIHEGIIDYRVLNLLYRDLVGRDFLTQENLQNEILRRAKLMETVARELVTEMQSYYNANLGVARPNELDSILNSILPFIARDAYSILGACYRNYHSQRNPRGISGQSDYSALQPQQVDPQFLGFDMVFLNAYGNALRAGVETQQELIDTASFPEAYKTPNIQPSTSYSNLKMILCGAAAVCAIAAAYVFRGSLIEGFSKLAEKLPYSSLADKAKDGYVNR